MFFPVPLRWSLLLMFCSITLHADVSQAQSPYPARPPAGSSSKDNGSDVDSPAIPDQVVDDDSTIDREGTQVRKLRGQFIEVGRRWEFTSDHGSISYRLLENLALQRAAAAIRQDAEDNHWTVHGTLTEFEGRNYLLLKAIVRAAREAPDPVVSNTASTRIGQTAP